MNKNSNPTTDTMQCQLELSSHHPNPYEITAYINTCTYNSCINDI